MIQSQHRFSYAGTTGRFSDFPIRDSVVKRDGLQSATKLRSAHAHFPSAHAHTYVETVEGVEWRGQKDTGKQIK